MKAPGTQGACNSFLIPLKVKKKKNLTPVSIKNRNKKQALYTAQQRSNKLKIQEYQNKYTVYLKY